MVRYIYLFVIIVGLEEENVIIFLINKIRILNCYCKIRK